jgi:signal transduction histidine kinase
VEVAAPAAAKPTGLAVVVWTGWVVVDISCSLWIDGFSCGLSEDLRGAGRDVSGVPDGPGGSPGSAGTAVLARGQRRADTAGMVERAARWTAAGCAATTCAIAVAAPLLARGLEGAPGVPHAVLHPQDVLIPPVYALTGAALVWLRTRNAVGWILLTIGVCGMSGTFLGVYGIRAYVSDAGLPAREIALSLASWLWLPALFLLPTLLPLLYPTGRLPSPRWRLVVISTAAGLVALAPVTAFTVESLRDWHADARPPLVLPAAAQMPLTVLGFGLLVVTSVACIGNAAWRLWHAKAPERAQLAWLLTATTAAAGLAFTAPVEWVFNVALVAVPMAVAVGVLRYGLLGIEVVLRPALLYGLLTLLVAVVFAGITAGVSALLPTGPLPTFIAAAVVAVGLVPAHARLRRFVGRLLDGAAADPLAAVSRVGRVVAGAGDAGLISQVLASVAEAVGAPYVALRDARGEIVAQQPLDDDAPYRTTVEIPLSYGGDKLGRLEVAAPPRGLTNAGQALLAALAPQVAVVTHAAALNTQLEDARRHLLDATQAERSRLHRDLHDGLGPSLSGVALGLESVRRALSGNPDRAGRILDRAQAEVRGAVDEVRRILDNLRPPTLDALGLVGALRAHAQDSADGLAVQVAADPLLTPLDPDVEAAAYRIALEALTNVHRHACATRCTVRLSADDSQLLVEVNDDGRGLPAVPREGVGWPRCAIAPSL